MEEIPQWYFSTGSKEDTEGSWNQCTAVNMKKGHNSIQHRNPVKVSMGFHFAQRRDYLI